MLILTGVVYNCRSSASWPDDIALSVTYIQSRRFTYAVMFGCRDDLVASIISRLSKCDLSTFHPLTFPTLFADIERNRHASMVEKYTSKLLERVVGVGILTQKPMSENRSEHAGFRQDNVGGSIVTDDHASVLDWLEMNHIRNGLQTWQTQLKVVVDYLAELEELLCKEGIEASMDNISQSMGDQGIRIKERILQIINEYDEKIRNCSTVIDGMTFATQTEWNHIARVDTQTTLQLSNLTMEISRATQRDGSQMRTIALMTMIFLPGTFVATLFSMTFFDWKIRHDEVISPYIWIYVVTTIVLTVATLGTWCYFTGKGQAYRRSVLPLHVSTRD
ncbi:hypothetical protein F4805DRAFT_229947 [Annulohypoxylon moriforme]|nr:hypothetical protein F4805DRAFT_229947 [Annulohypoxylon moriforme]